MAQDTFRQVYTPVSDEDKALASEIKQKAQELHDLMGSAKTGERCERDRQIQIGQTYLETSVMHAAKGVFTSPDFDDQA